MKKTNILTIIFTIMLCITPIIQSIPELPSTVRGSLYINGAPASPGTIIEAYTEDILPVRGGGNPHIVEENGKYSLAISGVEINTEVQFFILRNGRRFYAEQKYTFEGPGRFTNLNLTISAPINDTENDLGAIPPRIVPRVTPPVVAPPIVAPVAPPIVAPVAPPIVAPVAPVAPPVVVEMTISPNQATIYINETIRFTATTSPENIDQQVTWTIRNPEVGTIDATGLFTAKSRGTTNIIATSVVDPKIYATATIIVEEEPVANLISIGMISTIMITIIAAITLLNKKGKI